MVLVTPMKGFFGLQVENHCFRANCINGGGGFNPPTQIVNQKCSASPQHREPHIHRLAART